MTPLATLAVLAALFIAMPWLAIVFNRYRDIVNKLVVRRVRSRRDRTFHVGDGGGEVTVTAPMTAAEFEAFKTHWREMHRNRDAAHVTEPVRPLSDALACSAYQLPVTASDSGLCTRCGMYDYKHQEKRHA